MNTQKRTAKQIKKPSKISPIIFCKSWRKIPGISKKTWQGEGGKISRIDSVFCVQVICVYDSGGKHWFRNNSSIFLLNGLYILVIILQLSGEASQWTHHCIRSSLQKAYTCPQTHACTSLSLPLLEGLSPVISPSSTLTLPSSAVHPTQHSFSHTDTHGSLAKEFCCWQRRHKHSCQLAEVLQSDKKRISADSTPRSLFWAKYFVLPLQSCSPVNHQMFFATCVTFPSQYFYGLHATWQRVF